MQRPEPAATSRLLIRIAPLMSQNKRSLDKTLAGHLERRRARSQLRHLTIVPPQAVDFSSNSYLSLSTNPAVQSDFLSRLQTYAKNAPSTTTVSDRQNVPLLGSGGSRLLDGNSALAENIERQIAEFHRAESGLFFNSAFDANVGLFGCVPQVGDVIVYDELIHASVHDGMKLSRASRRVAFAHNCVRLDQAQEGSAQTASLEAVLRHLATGDEHYFRTGKKNVFIAVEGLYSMDGDLAPLREIVECVEEYFPAGNGYIIVDEAHSTGIYGDRGRGLVCHLGLENRVWARIHGFGKAMSCTGGVLLRSLEQHNVNPGTDVKSSLRYCSCVSYDSKLSHQLCAQSHLHNINDIPIAHQHPSNPPVPHGWPRRTASPAHPFINIIYPRPTYLGVQSL